MITIKFHEDRGERPMRGWDTDLPQRVARAEIHFLDGELHGLRLTGISVWADHTVSFPGSNRLRKGGFGGSYLSPISTLGPVPTLARTVLDAYDEYARASGIQSANTE